MLRCPETHEEAFLVMSTGEMVGRMVRSGILGCPVCRREDPILKGVVEFRGTGKGEGAPPSRPSDRKSTRLNSSHSQSSHAVFCLKKKKTWLFSVYPCGI